ncbi:MAG TPA: hypothetical protein VH251_06680 [Verrucomicrobiae bacterium]|jgi:hypothetical protein|nr:hypothetical protein [Verrucomicrobiae bacterium]
MFELMIRRRIIARLGAVAALEKYEPRWREPVMTKFDAATAAVPVYKNDRRGNRDKNSLHPTLHPPSLQTVFHFSASVLSD